MRKIAFFLFQLGVFKWDSIYLETSYFLVWEKCGVGRE